MTPNAALIIYVVVAVVMFSFFLGVYIEKATNGKMIFSFYYLIALVVISVVWPAVIVIVIGMKAAETDETQ